MDKTKKEKGPEELKAVAIKNEVDDFQKSIPQAADPRDQ